MVALLSLKIVVIIQRDKLAELPHEISQIWWFDGIRGICPPFAASDVAE